MNSIYQVDDLVKEYLLVYQLLNLGVNMHHVEMTIKHLLSSA
jgi:hypothetical protein